ncbi:MAG: glycoside hydrolase family 13 protein [Saccharofermentans sp.]|nr:glycoside hydrolase family 13 protein [Saccharofermentans sp.]
MSSETINTNLEQARCFHASRLPQYRLPFGARPAGSSVDLFFDCAEGITNITLCYTYGLYGFSYHEEPMHRVASSFRYHADLMLPDEACLLFYWFRFNEETEEGIKTFYYGAGWDTRDGEGQIYDCPPRVGADEDKYPYAFQITVHAADFKTPDYMKGSMIYQIFPDRFARDIDFDFDKMVNAAPRSERVYHEDWNEDVDIYGKPETGYLACDFFGGSLLGIAEKLEYIKGLGIDILYLNPIFEARSSHRYDTADYLNVDPILGGTEAFVRLQQKAQTLGIKIILDGVFSHTGADSKYFNKFGRFEGTGAYQSYRDDKESDFRSWYNFYKDEEGNINYDSWWGFPDLPNVNEDDLSYRRFIFGEGGVVKTWLGRGANGLRLDVSDELPDSFIRQMRRTIKSATDGEGMLIGEVWEDASNKCSYGSYRDFMLGNTHDSVMGYTFRHNLLDFLCGYISADIMDTRFEGFRERYPSEAYYCIMNLVSSHDVPRIMTMLSKPEDTDNREIQREFKVSPKDYSRCALLSQMAYAFQIAYIGASCIYYGDEVLMQGYKDPFNRRTYPWNRLTDRQHEALTFVRRLSHLRIDNTCLRTGYYKTLLAEGDVIVFERYLVEGKDFFGKEGSGARKIVFMLNRSSEPKYISVEDSYIETKAELIARPDHPIPIRDNIILGGKDHGVSELSIGGYSVRFLIY